MPKNSNSDILPLDIILRNNIDPSFLPPLLFLPPMLLPSVLSLPTLLSLPSVKVALLHTNQHCPWFEISKKVSVNCALMEFCNSCLSFFQVNLLTYHLSFLSQQTDKITSFNELTVILSTIFYIIHIITANKENQNVHNNSLARCQNIFNNQLE